MSSNSRPNSSPTEKALSVIIIGAGLGGLSAGLALRKQGHKVTWLIFENDQILEKSRFATETGAAIHVPPNCTVLLQWLGLNPEEFGANLLNHRYLYDQHGNVTAHNEFTQDMRKSWIAEWYLTHRVDFHNALKAAAESADGEGEPVALHTSCKVVSIDEAAGSVTLEDGREFRGDVLLGADGVHSIAREIVCPGTKPTKATTGCYRWLVPTSRLATAGETAEMVKQPGAMLEWGGADRRIIGYPCSKNTVFNLGAFLPTAEMGDTDEGGHSSSSKKDDLLRAFSGFSPGVRALIAEADEAKLKSWALMRIDPALPTWVRGRVAILGDAAHPFQPYFGQGAAMAIEDAVSVAMMLPLGTTPDQVPSRLALFERARIGRVATIQEYTRLNGQYAGQQHGLPVAEVLKAQDVAFQHNEREHSTRLLEEALK
ncbi:hypothetical protein VMCG_01002 [Cytospora schulzeri]|uniref:FAD-binding domain-containing protein n=1 Tax=Cytospora schulzeri TaxID=448051 RepID=A0A423X698_9PEZI|nr:hypothetical protein VMCG_01002 [Valsa malicola]